MTGPVAVAAADSTGAVRRIDAWPTGVPGLVVVSNRFTGHMSCAVMWSVLHARSGARMPYCLPDPEGALALAVAVGSVTDWQQPGDAVRDVMKDSAWKNAVLPFRQWRCRHGFRPATLENDNGVIA